MTYPVGLLSPMILPGFSSPVGPAEAERLHQASLQLLEEVGVRLEHDRIVDRLLRAGARPGPRALEVRFPRSLVAEYLSLAPSVVELSNRSGETTSLKSDSPPVFWTNPGLRILDTAGIREVTSVDLAQIARLCERLPNVQGVMGMAIADVPPVHRDFVGVRVIAENTRKHVRALCFTPAGMEALAEMKSVFAGNWLSIGFTAHGPLRWTNLALEIFEKSAGHGIPTTINGEPMAGVTGPVSLAGSTVVGNAEILAGIIVNQLLEPGRPVIYNLGLAHVFDMKCATAVTGGPENALFAAASAAMGRYYNLPSGSWVSTESLFDDGQAGLEKSFGFLTHMASGISLIWGMGQLESEKTISLVQLLIDNEAIDYARHFLKSFRVSDETLRLDLIEEVGIGGSFLDTDQTLTEFREHLWIPDLLNRKPRGKRAQPIDVVAREMAESLLAENGGPRLPPEALAELKRIEAVYREKIC